eukprot:1559525-Alexandrium_andersonii.AAC.1
MTTWRRRLQCDPEALELAASASVTAFSAACLVGTFCWHSGCGPSAVQRTVLGRRLGCSN